MVENMISIFFVFMLSFSDLQPGSDASDEPVCSKCPNEEQLLWKVLKIENKMEQWENELRKLQETVLSFFVHQRDEMKRSFDIQDKKNTEYCTECNNCMDQIRNMTPGTTEQIVAFSAYTTAGGSYSYNQMIMFPNVLLNLGNGYNSSSGYFTAPIAGLYLFITQACDGNNYPMVISIFHGERKIATGTVSVYDEESCMSLNGVAMLEVGEVASVKSTWSHSEMTSDNYRRPSFIGILIHTKNNTYF